MDKPSQYLHKRPCLRRLLSNTILLSLSHSHAQSHPLSFFGQLLMVPSSPTQIPIPLKVFCCNLSSNTNGPSHHPLTPIVSLLLYVPVLQQSNTSSHTPRRFVCSSLFSPAPIFHQDPPPPVMNQSLQHSPCSWCHRPDSFRGRTDGPDTCCRLVRPRNKSPSWQRRLGQ